MEREIEPRSFCWGLPCRLTDSKQVEAKMKLGMERLGEGFFLEAVLVGDDSERMDEIKEIVLRHKLPVRYVHGPLPPQDNPMAPGFSLATEQGYNRLREYAMLANAIGGATLVIHDNIFGSYAEGRRFDHSSHYTAAKRNLKELQKRAPVLLENKPLIPYGDCGNFDVYCLLETYRLEGLLAMMSPVWQYPSVGIALDICHALSFDNLWPLFHYSNQHVDHRIKHIHLSSFDIESPRRFLEGVQLGLGTLESSQLRSVLQFLPAGTTITLDVADTDHIEQPVTRASIDWLEENGFLNN